MNVYDFDGTIYNGDSTKDFYLFALKANPALLLYLPKQLIAFMVYAIKRINKTELKERFFCFLKGINTTDLVEAFWDANQYKIYDWYLSQQQAQDIVISASPEFLLEPICNRLGIEFLIASKVDSHTGKFVGVNCHGQEKVLRLQEKYGVSHIDKFYSDSTSDLPLAKITENAFLVKNGNITQWNIEGIL